jgi:ComF family protein
MLRFFYENFIPSRCFICNEFGEVNHGICSSCMSQIKPISEPVCDVCGRAIGSPGICISCQADPPAFDRLLGAACFEGVLKDVIHSFKYHRKTAFKKVLARILYDSLPKDADIDQITFVPLHWTRLATRGFNQASLIASELGKYMGVRIRFDALKKTRRTDPQVGLNQKQRLKNVRGSFKANGVEGKSVLVVDDVITTGATAKEVARVLKKAGARYVLVAGVGRVVQ